MNIVINLLNLCDASSLGKNEFRVGLGRFLNRNQKLQLFEETKILAAFCIDFLATEFYQAGAYLLTAKSLIYVRNGFYLYLVYIRQLFLPETYCMETFSFFKN